MPVSSAVADRLLDRALCRPGGRADDPQFWPNDPFGKAEQDFGVGGPSHLAGGEVPLPGGDLGDFERHAEPFFVLPHALVRAGQRRGAFVDAAFELLIRELQRLLRFLPFGDFALERLVELGQRPRLAEHVDEDADLRPQDRRVDRLAQIIDRANAVAAQDVVLVRPNER